MNTPVKMTIFRTTSAFRRNKIYFQEVTRKRKIDCTETAFTGQSTTTTNKELKEAKERRRELADEN